MTDNIYAHFVCSAIAGFVATVVGSPFDVIKTRMMSAKKRNRRCIYKRW